MSKDLVNHLLDFNKSAAGRDKLCRVFQYGSKFGWWYCESKNIDVELIKNLKTMEYTLSTARKAFRFGKSFDMMQSSLKSMHMQDVILRLTISFARFSQAFYLLFDHLVWLSRVGILKDENKSYTKMSYRFWLVSLICNLARNLYDIQQIIKLRKSKQSQKPTSGSNGMITKKSALKSEQDSTVTNCLLANKPVFLDTLKNAADVFIPMSNLGYLDTSAGFQGIMGVISSIVGMATVWDSHLKLVP